MGVQELEAELLKLPEADRARIAERLLASLQRPVANGGPESPKIPADSLEGRVGLTGNGDEGRAPVSTEPDDGTFGDLLAGYIGVLASSEHVPGGARMSENPGRRFAEGMVKRREQGRL